MTPLAIYTYVNFPKMFHIFHLADYSKVSTFFETLGIGESFYGYSLTKISMYFHPHPYHDNFGLLFDNNVLHGTYTRSAEGTESIAFVLNHLGGNTVSDRILETLDSVNIIQIFCVTHATGV